MKKLTTGMIILAALLWISCANPVLPEEKKTAPSAVDTLVSDRVITGVSAPIAGQAPVLTFTGSQFTGDVSWSPAVGATFATRTAYTATVTLTAKTGYTLTGVPANAFTLSGASAVSNPAGSGVVTAQFATTGLLVGSVAGTATAGYADGTGSSAAFNFPMGITRDAGGNLFIADRYNQRIRKVTPAGVVTTYAGSGFTGAENGAAGDASFNSPYSLVFDSQGNLIVADMSNQLIRKITPAGVVSTLAGSIMGYQDGTGTAARFNGPTGIAIDGNDNLYVTESFNRRIRKVTPGGVVTTLAGSGNSGYQDGTGTAASFSALAAITITTGGDLYVVDGNKIRKVTASGVVTTIAGVEASGSSDGTGTSASFNNPWNLTCDGEGTIYVADTGNHRIRKVTPAGVVSTYAGGSGVGRTDGLATVATFYNPQGLFMTGDGVLFVAEFNDIRKVY